MFNLISVSTENSSVINKTWNLTVLYTQIEVYARNDFTIQTTLLFSPEYTREATQIIGKVMLF